MPHRLAVQDRILGLAAQSARGDRTQENTSGQTHLKAINYRGQNDMFSLSSVIYKKINNCQDNWILNSLVAATCPTGEPRRRASGVRRRPRRSANTAKAAACWCWGFVHRGVSVSPWGRARPGVPSQQGALANRWCSRRHGQASRLILGAFLFCFVFELTAEWPLSPLWRSHPFITFRSCYLIRYMLVDSEQFTPPRPSSLSLGHLTTYREQHQLSWRCYMKRWRKHEPSKGPRKPLLLHQ